jgi:uncharacterized membrane protein YidH (DUF202 family)
MKPARPGTAGFQSTNKELAMYIGLGAIVVIVIIVLAVMFLRRA